MSAAAPRSAAVLLTPVLPWPGGSGRAWRAWHWLCELSAAHDVHVVVTDPDTPLQEHPADYPAASLLWLGRHIAPTRGLLLLAGWLAPPLAFMTRKIVMHWQHPASIGGALAPLRQRLGNTPVARFVVFRLYLHDVAVAMARSLRCDHMELDLDDLESQTQHSIAGVLWRLGRPAEASLSLASAIQYRLLEARVTPPYAQLWLAAPEDCARLSHRLGREVGHRPNRISLPALSPQTPPSSPCVRLLFVGTLNYPPNEEAARWLARELAPELRRRLNVPWRILIVGGSPASRLCSALDGLPGVELLADAEDLDSLYAAAHAVLIPLWGGGGTKLKTLEALAHRRPVIATAHGVRGLGLEAGTHFLPAESPTGFALAIERIVAEPELAHQLTFAGEAALRTSQAADHEACARHPAR